MFGLYIKCTIATELLITQVQLTAVLEIEDKLLFGGMVTELRLIKGNSLMNSKSMQQPSLCRK
jgi:hypothetical protein